MSEVPHDADEEERETVTIRRAPRFPVFGVLGGLVGFLVTLVVTSLYPADPTIGFAATLGFLSLFGIPAGILLGVGVAVLFDRRSSRRAATVIAGKLAVRVDDELSPTTDTNSNLDG